MDTRIAGARKAMARRARLKPETEWVLRGDPVEPGFVRQSVARHRPDANICANDNTAAVLLQS
ncbi:MAG: GntR family transcriptional regulator, partial [Kiritimatiellaeota bacterium]|nr:GntR family transcriptional regulator [Kiritimatiellota bacterium]